MVYVYEHQYRQQPLTIRHLATFVHINKTIFRPASIIVVEIANFLFGKKSIASVCVYITWSKKLATKFLCFVSSSVIA